MQIKIHYNATFHPSYQQNPNTVSIYFDDEGGEKQSLSYFLVVI